MKTKLTIVAAVAALALGATTASAGMFDYKQKNVSLNYQYMTVSPDDSSSDITGNGASLRAGANYKTTSESKWVFSTYSEIGYTSADFKNYAGKSTQALMNVGIDFGVGYEVMHNWTVEAVGGIAMVAQGDFYWWGPEGGVQTQYDFAKNWSLNAKYTVGSMKVQTSDGSGADATISRALVGIGYNF